MTEIHGVNVFSKHAYRPKSDGDGFKRKSVLEIEDLDRIVAGLDPDRQWIVDYEKMMSRRVHEYYING